MEGVYAALRMRTYEEKTTLLGNVDLTIGEWGEGDYGTQSHHAEPSFYLQV